MSDNHRQYQTIQKALKTCYPQEPEGHLARHLTTLAGLVSGIVSSKRSHLSKIAAQVPDHSLAESRVKRFSRWVDNDRIELATYFLPFATPLLASLPGPLVLVMDASAVGRGCATLLLSVLYRQRAVPLVWLVAKGKKGHFAEADHLALVQQLQPLMPADTEVVFLGDGEFDGIDLLQQLTDYGWKYVCRTAKNTILWQGPLAFSIGDIPMEEGVCEAWKNLRFTTQAYGPVHVILWWDKGYEEPIYLVTTIAHTAKACAYYRKRFNIETFFSDQKSRGFHLHKSHIADPQRLARLMIAACLAYLWILYLGTMAMDQGWVGVIHRNDRCDLSLFQLGLLWRDFLLNEVEYVPVAFLLIELEGQEYVR